jgi:NAD+ synthase (glutamine-hydrolysing)
MKEKGSVSAHPFGDWCGPDEVFRVQCDALSVRLGRIGVKSATVGLSGGLDSTLCLLVAAEAFKILKLPKKALKVYTMPGFGTTKRTKGNAALLCEGLGLSLETIDITKACLQHFRDIGHDPEKHDVTYENVQARMRTMVLMDIANMERALVVGTGDLSEIALGWNTYNGDHMSMYQINCSVPKTMVLGALKLIADESPDPLRSLLAGIASAPITPELVPGAAANDSEARLGPYELHDFFLFHYLANGADADKLAALARIAFKGAYPGETIARTRQTFLCRFRQSQYKRNCVPDGPKITLSLSPRADWRMPSDLP